MDAILEAMMYMAHDPDPTHLHPTQLAREIDLTGDAAAKYLRHGFLMQNLKSEFPEFTPAPTREHLASILNLSQHEANPDLAAAKAITQKRVDAASPTPPEPSQ